MPYDLTNPADRARMMEDVDECAPPHTGYTPLRQIDAYTALRAALAAGYVLVPPVTEAMRTDAADWLADILADGGTWMEDDDLAEHAAEIIAIARGGEK